MTGSLPEFEPAPGSDLQGLSTPRDDVSTSLIVADAVASLGEASSPCVASISVLAFSILVLGVFPFLTYRPFLWWPGPPGSAETDTVFLRPGGSEGVHKPMVTCSHSNQLRSARAGIIPLPPALLSRGGTFSVNPRESEVNGRCVPAVSHCGKPLRAAAPGVPSFSWNLPSRVVQLLATSFFLLVHLPSMQVLFLGLHRRACSPSCPRLTERPVQGHSSRLQPWRVAVSFRPHQL